MATELKTRDEILAYIERLKAVAAAAANRVKELETHRAIILDARQRDRERATIRLIAGTGGGVILGCILGAVIAALSIPNKPAAQPQPNQRVDSVLERTSAQYPWASADAIRIVRRGTVTDYADAPADVRREVAMVLADMYSSNSQTTSAILEASAQDIRLKDVSVQNMALLWMLMNRTESDAEKNIDPPIKTY